MAGVVKGTAHGKTGGRGGASLPSSGDTIDSMMGGSGTGGSGSGGSGGKGGNITIVRCCTSGEAPQCHLFCEGTHIYLPLPLKIQSSTGANWNNVDSSSGGIIAKSLTGSWNDGSFKAALSTAMNGLKQTVAQHKMNALMAAAGLESGEFLMAKHGVAAIPAKELSFDGIDFRKFTFTWRLVPLDEKDSKQIHKFVKHVQRHMLPSTAAGLVGYPDLWAVNWKQGDEGMPIIKDAYVSQFDVDYSGAGQYTFVHNRQNEPVAFIITLSIIEATIFSREDVDAGIYG